MHFILLWELFGGSFLGKTYVLTFPLQEEGITSIISKANAEETINEDIEDDEIELNSVDEKESNNYSVLLYIIISVFWVLISIVLLKREKLI